MPHPYIHHQHGGFRHGGYGGRRRPWLFRHHPGLPWGQDGGGDGDGDGDGGPPPSQPSFPFPLPFPLPSLEMGEAEAERHHRRRWRPEDDQETGLNDEPFESRDEDGRPLRRRGRWIRSNGRLILFGV
jgi:hypothetical protein